METGSGMIDGAGAGAVFALTGKYEDTEDTSIANMIAKLLKTANRFIK
jgi:hypothetical protein